MDQTDRTYMAAMARQSSRNRHEWAGEPGRLIIHDDPYDIWSKLSWEANEFYLRRTDEERPLDIDGVIYLLQNACISVVAVVEWLALDAKQSIRKGGHRFASEEFDAEVARWLPNFQLARAIANTFKHGEYRDEGWGTAEMILETIFSEEQHARLRAAQGTERFHELLAQETAEADFRLTFRRPDMAEIVEAGSFVQSLSDGALRLLDATYGDRERFIAMREQQADP